MCFGTRNADFLVCFQRTSAVENSIYDLYAIPKNSDSKNPDGTDAKSIFILFPPVGEQKPVCVLFHLNEVWHIMKLNMRWTSRSAMLTYLLRGSFVTVDGRLYGQIDIVKNPKLRRRVKANLSTAIYGNETSDCLLSRSQRLIGL